MAGQSILNDPQRRQLARPTRRYRLRGRLRCLSCGTPMVGQALGKGRYVYYRCRRSYAGSFEATCDSKYVPVAPLEQTVLEQVLAVLSDPARIIVEARRLSGQEVDESRAKDIAEEIGKIEDQQRRLADLYINGSLPQDILDSKSQMLSHSRILLEAENRKLNIPRSDGLDLDLVSKYLPSATARIKDWVLQASDADIELILRGLDIQIRASGEEVQIQGSIPFLVGNDEDLVTIAQTSA